MLDPLVCYPVFIRTVQRHYFRPPLLGLPCMCTNVVYTLFTLITVPPL